MKDLLNYKIQLIKKELECHKEKLNLAKKNSESWGNEEPFYEYFSFSYTVIYGLQIVLNELEDLQKKIEEEV